LIAEHGLEFPIGHSADADAVADATGAFVNQEPHYLQSTGFVLGPRRTGHRQRVLERARSAALVPDDVIGLIGYVREHTEPPRCSMTVTRGILALLEAKPGKGDELARFLEAGRALAWPSRAP